MKTEQKTDAQKAAAVRTYAQQCNGSEDFYRHSLARRMVYTNGAKFLAEECGAWWLVDAIASYIATTKAVQAEDFQVWTLKHHDVCGKTLLLCTNGNDDSPIIASQTIDYTDFPRELMPFRFFCERGELEPGSAGFVLMLPEER
jgi:hypothetical protein